MQHRRTKWVWIDGFSSGVWKWECFRTVECRQVESSRWTEQQHRRIGYHFSSGWSTRSVYWSTSASIKQLHRIWLRCAFPSQQPTTDVTSALQHTATWQFHESDWQDTEEVSLCLVRCCGTHYHWLSVMYEGHCGACRRKWRLTDTDLCPCGETHTMSYIVESCPLTKLNGDLSRLHSADEDAVLW